MRRPALASLIVLFALDPALAGEAPWHITAQEGAVRVAQPGQQPADGALNQPLAAGTTVTTGAASHAKLENGLQSIDVGANSRMTIAADSNDGMTRILQGLGTILFQVDHREAQHFTVETPLLAAVVKGTIFTVTSMSDRDQVHVASGLVEVHALKSNMMRDVASGETASIMHASPGTLAIRVPNSEPPLASGNFNPPPVDVAKASDGVVGGRDNDGAGSNLSNARSISWNANMTGDDLSTTGNTVTQAGSQSGGNGLGNSGSAGGESGNEHGSSEHGIGNENGHGQHRVRK